MQCPKCRKDIQCPKCRKYLRAELLIKVDLPGHMLQITKAAFRSRNIHFVRAYWDKIVYYCECGFTTGEEER